MDSVREQMELSNELSEAISHPAGLTNYADEEEFRAELEAFEQDQLNDRLLGAERAPVHTPGRVGESSRETIRQQEEEDDEDAQLRQLQAEMAM